MANYVSAKVSLIAEQTIKPRGAWRIGVDESETAAGAGNGVGYRDPLGDA